MTDIQPPDVNYSGLGQAPDPGNGSVAIPATPQPDPNTPTGAVLKASADFQTPNTSNKGILRKSAEDVATLGSLPAYIINNPGKTAEGLVDPSTYVDSFAKMGDANYYDQHPVLAAINSLANASMVGGLLLDSSLVGSVAGVPLSIFGLITKAGLGIVERSATDLVLETGAASARSAVMRALPNKVLHSATQSILETGSTDAALDTLKANLVHTGVDADSAANIAKSVADGLSDNIDKYKTPIKILQSVAHPLDASLGAIGKAVTPGMRLVFGEADKSAVQTIVGADAVKANPVMAASVEDWLTKQVQERDLPPTQANKVLVGNEWSQSNPQWAAATGQERLDIIHTNFIGSDTTAALASKMTGDPIVSTKIIPPNDLQAMKENVLQAGTEEFQQVKNADGSFNPPPIIKALTDIHGSQLGNFKDVLTQAYEKNPTRQGLIDVLDTIASGWKTAYPKDSEVSGMLEKAKAQYGYNYTLAPEGKMISHTAEADAAVTGKPTPYAGMTNDEIVSKLVGERTQLGKIIENIGLSPGGLAPNSSVAAFADNFSRAITDKLGEQFPNGIKVASTINPRTGEAVNIRTIPLDKIFQYIDDTTGKSVSEVSKDFLMKELKIGDTEAQGIVDASRQSLKDIPLSKTGLGEGLVNWVRNTSPVFDAFMRASVVGRYNMNPAFGLRVLNKINVLAVMRAGIKAMYVSPYIEETLAKIPYVGDLMSPPVNVADALLFRDEIASKFQEGDMDLSSNAENMTYAQRMQVQKSLVAQNALLKFMKYDTESHAIRFATALAEKQGLTLKQAFGSQMMNGIKVYDYPTVVQGIREAQQAVFHYSDGFLSSPLLKTMNLVWFPIRFEAKVMNETMKWMSGLTAEQRLVVYSGFTHFTNFLATPEGQTWKKDNQDGLYQLTDYLLPYHHIGLAMGSAMQGKLFDGNMGMLGGMPFAGFISILDKMGVIDTQSGVINETTGKPYKREVPKNLMSETAAVTAINTMLTYMVPSIPATKILGSESTTKFANDFLLHLEGSTIASTKNSFGGNTSQKKEMADIKKGFKTVTPDYRRWHPIDDTVNAVSGTPQQ